MPSMNAIRIRRYNRLCKVADRLLTQAKHSGFAEGEASRLARVEAIMEELRCRISTGPHSYRGSRNDSAKRSG